MNEEQRTLSDDDVDRIASKLIEKTKAQGHEFWIDPEKHYNEHKDLSQLLKIYNETTSAVRKVFIGLLIVAIVMVASFPMVSKWKGG